MLKKILGDRFFRSSIWIYISTAFLNLGNYLYHTIMARTLHPSAVGAVESTINLVYILSIPLLTLTTVFVKYTSSYKGMNDYKSIATLSAYFRKRIFMIGLPFTLFLLLLSPFITSFLHLPSLGLSLLLVLAFFIGLFTALYKSLLQGLLEFFQLTVANTVEIILKLLFAILFIWLGFEATGAFGAITVSSFFGVFVAAYFVRRSHIPTSEEELTDKKHIFSFAIPVFLTTLAMTSLFTSDAIIVRHFFPGVESGYYSWLSLLGKVIFFAVSPLTQVLFPFISEYHSAGKKYSHYLYLCLSLTFLGGLAITLIYYFFPTLIIYALPGQRYMAIAPLIWYFGVFIVFYSLCYLLSNFYLSVHTTKPSYLIVASAIAQIVFISLFHSNLREVITVSVVISGLLLLSLLVYYPYSIRAHEKK